MKLCRKCNTVHATEINKNVIWNRFPRFGHNLYKITSDGHAVYYHNGEWTKTAYSIVFLICTIIKKDST